MKFLLIQLRRIGDVLMTTPAIRCLRQAFPQANLSFLTTSPSEQLLKYNPHLDQLLVYPNERNPFKILGFLMDIRRTGYDCVIDFQGNPRTALLSRFSGSPYRIGFNYRGRSWVYHKSVNLLAEKAYSGAHKLQLLKPLGVDDGDLDLEMPIGEEECIYVKRLFDDLDVDKNRLRVSVSPGSRQPYKVWPPAGFARITDWLIEAHQAQVFFLHGPGEEHFIEAVKKEMKQKPLPSIGIPNLLQTRALLEKMHLHFGNDNGLRHLAIAGGTPTAAVFGRPHAFNWTPPARKQHRFVEYDPGCKSSCTYPRCEHLNCINAIDVLSVQKMLQESLVQDLEINAASL